MRGPYLAASIIASSCAAILATGPQMPVLAFVVIALASGSTGMVPLIDARTIARLAGHRDWYGVARAWGSITFVVISPLLGMLADVSGIVAIWWVYIAGVLGAGIMGALTLGRAPRNIRVASIGPLAGLRLLRLPGLALLLAGNITSWTASTAVMTYYSIWIVQMGGDAVLVGIGWSLNAALEIPLMLLYPRLASRWPVHRLVVGGLLALALRAALWSVVDGVGPVLLITALGGVGFAPALVGLATYVSRRAPAELAATAQALFGATCFALGTILGSLIAGVIAGAWDLEAIFPVGAAGSLAGAVMVWMAMRAGARTMAASA